MKRKNKNIDCSKNCKDCDFYKFVEDAYKRIRSNQFKGGIMIVDSDNNTTAVGLCNLAGLERIEVIGLMNNTSFEILTNHSKEVKNGKNNPAYR